MPKRKGAGYAIRIDSFNALDLPAHPSYEQVKLRALTVGRFSTFEAGANQHTARLFDRLAHDPEVELDISGSYPWTKVRNAEA